MTTASRTDTPAAATSVAEATGAAVRSPARSRWTDRHLLDVASLGWPELARLVRLAASYRPLLERPTRSLALLRGRTVTLLFHEASTRTRVSFEVAARTLGADVVNVAVAASSTTKGESLADTLRTLEALGGDVLVLRHGSTGAPWHAIEAWHGSVVNAGDGRHAHPTQALLDLLTILDRLAPTVVRDSTDAPAGEPPLRGRKVAIVGDLVHSRVARSNLWSLTAAGADVWVAGPPTLLRGFAAWAASGVAGNRPFRVTTDADEAVRDADVVMTLRLQHERMASGLVPSLAEYRRRHGIDLARLGLARPGAFVMHPGPMNEGIEIAPELATHPRSVVLDQVANGVAVRMAVLALVAEANGWVSLRQ